jgi:hypothetical protein
MGIPRLLLSPVPGRSPGSRGDLIRGPHFRPSIALVGRASWAGVCFRRNGVKQRPCRGGQRRKFVTSTGTRRNAEESFPIALALMSRRQIPTPPSAQCLGFHRFWSAEPADLTEGCVKRLSRSGLPLDRVSVHRRRVKRISAAAEPGTPPRGRRVGLPTSKSHTTGPVCLSLRIPRAGMTRTSAGVPPVRLSGIVRVQFVGIHSLASSGCRPLNRLVRPELDRFPVVQVRGL